MLELDLQEHANKILNNEKGNLHLGVIEAQHKRLIDEIASGISDVELEVTLRLALKTFEDNYLKLQELKNEE